MRFEQPEEARGMLDRSNTVELWEGDRQVATIHATRSGIRLECAPGWEPEPRGMAIELQAPYRVVVSLERSGGS